MPSNYRNQRRQGVVYGPVGSPGNGGGTAILGTLLGVLVVFVAMAMLAVAAFAFIGDLSSSPTPPSSQIANASASPSGSQGGTGSDSPAPSGSGGVLPSGSPGQPSPSSAVPSPTPSGGTFVPQVEVGPGYVTFGTKTNKKLRVTNARATFSSSDARIVWSAYLSSPANASDLHIHILKLNPSASDGKQLLWDHQLTIHATGAQIYKSHLRTHTALQGPGIYEVQYVRGDQVLADGFFKYTG